MARTPEPFVGRGVELELLGAELDMARAGRSRLVWIDAPAGMGKTTLVRRFLDEVEPPLVLWGAGEDGNDQVWGMLRRLLAHAPGGRSSRTDRLRSSLDSDVGPSAVGPTWPMC